MYIAPAQNRPLKAVFFNVLMNITLPRFAGCSFPCSAAWGKKIEKLGSGLYSEMVVTQSESQYYLLEYQSSVLTISNIASIMWK